MEDVRFRDRTEAGRMLATRLEHYRGRADAVVLGLPRGGVVPAAEIARRLDLPLDVIISRKLGAPGNPELAVGAVSELGEPWLDPELIGETGASRRYLESEIARQRVEITRRQGLFRGGRPLSLPEPCTVILVDDGIATGSTMFAAIRALRALAVKHVVAAVPVAPPDRVHLFRAEVDELVVLATPEPFWAVGSFYERFRQVSDEEVSVLLAEAEREGRRPHAAADPLAAG